MKIFKYVKRGISKTLEIPEDSLGHSSRLQIIGDSVLLCGCRKIINYKSEEISVLTNDQTVTVLGEHLKCLYFFEGTIEIGGEINGVRLEKR